MVRVGEWDASGFNAPEQHSHEEYTVVRILMPAGQCEARLKCVQVVRLARMPVLEMVDHLWCVRLSLAGGLWWVWCHGVLDVPQSYLVSMLKCHTTEIGSMLTKLLSNQLPKTLKIKIHQYLI